MPSTIHPKWTADDLAIDLCCVLRSDLPLHPRTREGFVDQILWKYVEIGGKYKGCPLASPDAITVIDEKAPGWKSRIRLDHAVPRGVLSDAILANPDLPLNECREALRRLAVAVVLTEAEDAALGKHARSRMACGACTLEELMSADIFGRYRLASQPVCDRKTGERLC